MTLVFKLKDGEVIWYVILGIPPSLGCANTRVSSKVNTSNKWFIFGEAKRNGRLELPTVTTRKVLLKNA